MAIKVTNKKPLTGNKRSHALNATKMQQKPNLQVVRLEDGTKVRMSAREIRNMRKQQAVVAEVSELTYQYHRLQSPADACRYLF